MVPPGESLVLVYMTLLEVSYYHYVIAYMATEPHHTVHTKVSSPMSIGPSRHSREHYHGSSDARPLIITSDYSTDHMIQDNTLHHIKKYIHPNPPATSFQA